MPPAVHIAINNIHIKEDYGPRVYAVYARNFLYEP